MTEPSERTIRKFNPGTFQSDAEVIGQFVVRKRELDIVLDVLRGNVDSPSCQHALLVAHRGRGKTMLLARVAAELRTNDALSKRLLPVRFMEESQEIMDSGDFWLEALFHLAAETAKRKPDFSQELREAHDDLAGRPRGEELDRRARATVLDAADRLGRRLVLMVENLQDLCGDVDDDFGWKLREALQTEPQIMLLATATSRFNGLDDPKQPFFELFRTVLLAALDIDECRRLWQEVSGDDQIDRDIRPLKILTGGNPRLLVIVAQFARHRSLRQLMEELVTLIDDHTEYFRSHLQGFAKTERLVYLAVIDLWQPSSTAEIAARSRRDVRVVSAMLGRLANRGAVSVEGSGRKRRYAAAERLYSIYYKLRRQRDEAAVIQNLIRFMAAFYSGPELEGTKLSIEATQELAIREGLERASAEDPQVEKLFSNYLLPSIERVSKPTSKTGRRHAEASHANLTTARTLFDNALTHFERDEHEVAIEVYNELIERFGDSEAPEIQETVAKALFNKGVTLGLQKRFAATIEVCDELVERFGDSEAPEIQELVAKALFNKGVALRRQKRSAAAIEVCDELVERFGDSEAPAIQELVAKALLNNKGLTLWRQERFAAAIEVCDELIGRFGDSEAPAIQEQVAKALFNKGVTLRRQKRFADEIEVYDELVERFGDSEAPAIQEALANALLNKGVTLRRQERFADEIEVYDELVERFGDSEAPAIQEQVTKALFNKGFTLQRQERFAAAIEVCDELVERFGDSEAPAIQEAVANALLNKGVTLGRQEKFAAAIEVYDELVERFGDSEAPAIQETVAKTLVNEGRAALIRTMELIRQGDHHAAMNSFSSAYAGFRPTDETMVGLMIADVIELVATGAQQRGLLDILLMEEEKSAALAPLVVALRKDMGEQVRASAEVMEVAQDIIKMIEGRRASGGRS